MLKRCLFFLILPLLLSGCATIGFPPVEPQRYPLGSIQNPIIDSNITLSEAIRKWAPSDLKRRQDIVDVFYYSFDGKVHKGQVVIDGRLARDIREVFKVALAKKFPIKSAIPVSHNRFYSNGAWNSDGQSMKANNTSAFNYRNATGAKVLSMHAYGYAIDINPVQNPYIKGRKVLPYGAVYRPDRPGTFTRDCAVVKTFKRLGWAWGGEWKSLKDYQHFEKVLPD